LPLEHKNNISKIKGTVKKQYVFAICDGMSGTLYGDTASFIAVQSLKENFESTVRCVNGKPKIEVISKLVHDVNQDICSFSKSKDIQLGSTIALLYINEDEIIISNVGDSRIYQLHNGEIKQLSKDHNQAYFMYEAGLLSKEDMRRHRGRHQLTQFLGIHSDEMIIDPYIECLSHKDGKVTYLLCSDGLVEVLEDEYIKNILELKISLRKKVNMLVEGAIKQGSKDNITAVVIELTKKN
jgi:protein phosphatase